MTGPKETVFDTQVQPLLERIYAICREHQIAALASFRLDDSDAGDGQVVMAVQCLFREALTQSQENALDALRITRVDPALTQGTAELREAFGWTCDHCGRDQLLDVVVPENRDGIMVPYRVQCRHCDAVWFAAVPESYEQADDEEQEEGGAT